MMNAATGDCPFSYRHPESGVPCPIVALGVELVAVPFSGEKPGKTARTAL